MLLQYRQNFFFMNNNNFIEEKGNSSYTKSIQQYCQNLKVIKKERK
jgi:hypothetical protein